MNPADEELFVGRTKEAAGIRSEIGAGHNVVLTGPFGIGRTALLRHMAKDLRGDWRFIFLDGSQTPARLCEQLVRSFTAERSGAARQPEVPWKMMRHRLEILRSRDARPTVLVIDDLAKTSWPKLSFMEWLEDVGRFRIVAVAERFMPQNELTRLRSALYPAPLIRLGPLSPVVAQTFFETWSRRSGLEWGPDHIHGLAVATHGYPLGMWAAAKKVGGVGPRCRFRGDD